MEKDIEEYIEKQPPHIKQIIFKVREIFFKTLPHCSEKKKWGVITLGNDKFYIAAINNRVHIGFAITDLSNEEIKLFEGTGKTMRHIKIFSVEDIDEKNIVELIRLVDKKSICNTS
jgi:hypothetical protein